MIQEIRFYIFIFFITTQINKKEKFPRLTSMAMLRRTCLEFQRKIVCPSLDGPIKHIQDYD